MARRLRAAWRLARSSLHILHGTWVAVVLFPKLDAAARVERVQWWSLKTLRLMGVELQALGEPHPGAKLLTANHVSWLDVMVIHAVCPQARFVSKSDVKRWPVLGALVAGVGTLFIERERKRDALRVVHQMAQALRDGDTLAIFPEGTTSEGHSLLPFHANLLQAAITAGTPVQPVALRFSDAAGPVSRAVQYVGDTSLVQSLWWVACGEQVRVRVQFLSAQPVHAADRRSAAQTLAASIEAALNGRGEAPTPRSAHSQG
jgi:1-acyl-sn-glycerol-3-phosphate acyltransferase